MDKYIGKVLDGRYEILEEVGNGGMAVVYKAKDFDTGAIVAVKILREEYLDNEEFCRRFRNESRAIALLNHPNIVKIFDVCNSPSLQYIVMEYIDGISLKDYIEQQRVVRVKEAVHFTTQILRALMHAHSKGIVHRDIKPQNIMLLPNGRIKVTDFGIARLITSQTSTMTDKAIGSVHYIAPEQARGAVTDARADLYSVGVMLYEMLTGKLPFEANSAVSVAVMQLQADPKMPRQINPNIPVGLEEITIQAMQKDPNARYQSAAEMLQDLENFKLNPGIKFNYKYIVEDNTRYSKSAQNLKKSESSEEEYKSPVIPVLTGIATAFVLVAVVFVVIFIDASGILKKNTSEQVKLPNFVGQVYNEILESQKYDFEFYKEEKFSSEIAEGVVMEQNPKPDKMVYSDSRVKLVVSKGPERLMVPDFQNMTYTQYTQLLKQQGLAYVEMPIYDENTPLDIVCNTNPQPRQEVQIGDVIEVYYSLGPKTEEQVMRNFVNMPYVSAKSQLDSLGITIAEATKVDSNKPEGTIISQEPPHGTKLTKDTVVKFTISNGKAPESTVTLKIELPESSQDVTLEVFLDDVSIKAANVSLASQKTYSIKLTGSGTQKVTVTLNGKKYRDYKVNFKNEKSSVSKEYDISWLSETSSEAESKAETESATEAEG
ncbi:MAG: Stk1 family PASTA domain-containing Ser/Thr kinase [Clostridia bacterium]|jgi:serine/threonine-protein kinase|nr:Stk1 family PASTA domain-containing Ser/Thr kinase [Clostridia bacterium]